MSDEHERLRRIEGDLELIQARVGGVHDNLLRLYEDLNELVGAVTTIAGAVNGLRAEFAVGVSTITPVDDTRKVWVVEVPEDAEWMIGSLEVLIEQFGDRAPTVAFRRGGNPAVWGRPYRGEPR